MLDILRLQLGKWFTTGYSLNAVLHPWNIVKYSKPLPNQWKYGLPLATASYCWWPCSMSLCLAGLAMLRGRALGLVTAFVFGCLPYIAYAEYLDRRDVAHHRATGRRDLDVHLAVDDLLAHGKDVVERALAAPGQADVHLVDAEVLHEVEDAEFVFDAGILDAGVLQAVAEGLVEQREALRDEPPFAIHFV